MADLEPPRPGVAAEYDLAVHMKTASLGACEKLEHNGDGEVRGGAADDEALNNNELLGQLEVFLSSPEFTGALQDFVSANDSIYVSVDKGKEQPLSNYDLYQKYIKMIESQLEGFLQKYDLNHQDIAELCAQERNSNRVNFAIDYVVASTEYDAFLQVMEDARAIANFTLEDCIGSELAAYECLGLDGGLEGQENEDTDGSVKHK